MKLYDYGRSSAAWRVRIALCLKNVSAESVSVHLRSGQQKRAEYLAVNPQGFVPTLDVDGNLLTQSLAIVEWLDEVYPTPPLLPAEPLRRAHVRAFALAIAADTHPLQNLRVLQRLRDSGWDEDRITRWARDFIRDGLMACAQLIASEPGPFSFGEKPTLAEVCLIPQLFNDARFGVSEIAPRLLSVGRHADMCDAFRDAVPDVRPR